MLLRDKNNLVNPNSQNDKIMTEQELFDGLKRIAEAQEATMRQCRIMVAGFKATGEQDIRYMDGFMDGLWDFMEQCSDTEGLYRDYLAYISSFNPEEGKRRFLDLEDSLGYWTPAVIAAGRVAREVHHGQKDKGGNDYFESHLLPVAKSGFTWKEKIVGFLHDAIEDTDYTTETLFEKVEDTLHKLSTSEDEEWKIEFDLMPYPGDSIFFPSENDWKEMADALAILNHHTAPNRKEYIKRFCENELALNVKLNDMKNNMDISRIPSPTPQDYERLERYKTEYKTLLDMLPPID